MPGPEKNKIPPQFPIDLPHVKNALKFYKDCCQAMLTLLLDHPDPATKQQIRQALEAVTIDIPSRGSDPCMDPVNQFTLCDDVAPIIDGAVGQNVTALAAAELLQQFSPVIELMIEGLDRPGIIVNAVDFGAPPHGA